jgi:hypothetical protein
VQREDLDIAVGQQAWQRARQRVDLAPAGQEHQHVAWMLRECVRDRAARLRLQ